MKAGTQAYARVPSEDSLPMDEELNLREPIKLKCLRKLRRLRIPWGLVSSTAFFLGSLIVLFAAYHAEPSDQDCVRKMSAPSPFHEAVEYEWQTFKMDFFQPSIYRGSPTPELEKAWDDLWDYGIFNVPIEMLPRLNKSTDGWRRVPEEHGGGVAGLLEGFHQIHCLNLIRQYTYRDQYDYSHLPSFDGTPELVRAHIDHCIESLRVNLMCSADTTPYLIKLDPTRLLGEDPDFNTYHKCRKWDKLVDFAKSREISRVVDPASAEDHHH